MAPLLLTLAVALAGALAGGCATVRPPYDYASEPDPRKEEYVLGPSDVLHVNVWHNTDLSGEAIVRPDGTISMPLIGDVRAAGRTPGQVRGEIAQKLAAFIKDEAAIVTVAVSAIHSYRFIVSGNVEHSGEFTSNHYVTVIEAIALAGGPTRFASPEQSVLIRTDPTRGVRRIPIDYPALVSGAHPEQDLALVAGDRIHVP
jgi:polysaccharide export outer membrane protein